MNYNQMQWMQMQQAQGMPFYMAYPIRNVYMTEMEYERDRERMNQLYPKEAKDLQKYVEDECDKLEYEGSMMFDEYPDRVMLKMICDRIYQEYTAENGKANKNKVESMQARPSNCRNCPQDRPPMGPGRPPMRPGNDSGLNNLIEVLLYNEMYKRRCRHRRCRQWW